MQRFIDPNGLDVLVTKFATGTEDLITRQDWKAILFGVNVADGLNWTLRDLGTAGPNEELIFYVTFQFFDTDEETWYLYTERIRTFLTNPATQANITTAAIAAGSTATSLLLSIRAAVINPGIYPGLGNF